jgi:hypothetical protein
MKDDDKNDLYDALYGPSGKVADGKSTQKSVATPASAKPLDPKTLDDENRALLEEAMGRDASAVFAQTFAVRRDARPVGKVSATSVHVPVKANPALAAKAEADARPSFADSFAPWTFIRGFGVILMLTYIVGFHGQLLAESWLTLLVVAVAILAIVLGVDFIRLKLADGK